MKSKLSTSHDEWMTQQLRVKPDFAREYLNVALEEDDSEVLLIALRRLAIASGGMTKIAKSVGIERESLYRALSKKGNPRLSTLTAVMKAVGLKITVESVR